MSVAPHFGHLTIIGSVLAAASGFVFAAPVAANAIAQRGRTRFVAHEAVHDPLRGGVAREPREARRILRVQLGAGEVAPKAVIPDKPQLAREVRRLDTVPRPDGA